MSHVSKLLNLEVKENPDKNALRILFNKVKTHVRSLEVLNITAAQYSVFLVPIVLSKLTHLLRVQWGKTKQENIVELLDFMQSEIEGLEDAIQVETAFSSQDKEQVPKKRYSRETKYHYNATYVNPSTASALATSTKKLCIFCPSLSNHYVDQCKKAKSLNAAEIREILYKENACLCCFKKGHRIAECRSLSKLTCDKCKGKHHSLLHDDRQKATEKK